MNGKLLFSVVSVLHESNRQTDLCRFLHVQSLSSVSLANWCFESHRGYSLWKWRTVVNTSSIAAWSNWRMDLFVFVRLNTNLEELVVPSNEIPKAKHANRLSSVWLTWAPYWKHPLRRVHRSQWRRVEWHVVSYVHTVMSEFECGINI